MKTLLVTGGAGFVGSNLAILFKEHGLAANVIAIDNLKRRGSELNLPRLQANGVEFIHGDVRVRTDLDISRKVDCIIDCAAEPSVLAGHNSSPEYVVASNLTGTANCLDIARRCGADFIFLSTSRVYPYGAINSVKYGESGKRYELARNQHAGGVSAAGFSEEFPMTGARTLYGATKLASELLIQEYTAMYGIRSVINRCGVLAGPWQMGKVDQGFITFWIARHVFGGKLNYIGFNGSGKQVRDILHVNDLFRLLQLEMKQLSNINGDTFNVGGGKDVSLSLLELTDLCEIVTGKRLRAGKASKTRPGDIRLYLSDYGKIGRLTGWSPSVTAYGIVDETAKWIIDNRNALSSLLA